MQMTRGAIEIGDSVQLNPRGADERAEWWWIVSRITDYGLDCVHERRSSRGVRNFTRRLWRYGVGEEQVRAHRKPDEAA